MGTRVEVARIPHCDLCTAVTPAVADARLKTGHWANLCMFHFKEQGCRLGTGYGQELVLK